MHCGGQMQRQTVPFQITRKGYHLTFEQVAAWVCSQCGEAYFEEAEVNQIQLALAALDKQAEKLAKAG
jgi:YgiT-type zinc finger domain-containing protein